MTQIEQQQQQPTASAAPSRASIVRIAAIFILVFGATALLVRCVAVATQSPHGHSSAGQVPATKSGPVLTLEQLGAKAGCHPTVQTNAAELRQGYCSTPSGGRFFLTTFATSKGQLAWLEQAKDYGALLVGNRWVVGAKPEVLQQLRGKLGGEIYDVADHNH